MYNKNFFQKHFALTPTQAEDYTKAFHRICYLLQDYDSLHKHRHHYIYRYEKEAFELLGGLAAVNNQAASAQLLQKAGFFSLPLNKTEAAAAAKALLSIADTYIWPASVYDDWQGVEAYREKTMFSSRFYLS